MAADFLSEMVFECPEPVWVPVTRKLPNGADDKLRLFEATAGAGQIYRDYMMSAAKMRVDDSGNVKVESIGGIASIESLLVSRCLFRVTENGGLIPVHETEIQKWGGPVVTALFERIKKLSPWLDSGGDKPKN